MAAPALKSSYPLYLANAAKTPNQDLVVTDDWLKAHPDIALKLRSQLTNSIYDGPPVITAQPSEANSCAISRAAT